MKSRQNALRHDQDIVVDVAWRRQNHCVKDSTWSKLEKFFFRFFYLFLSCSQSSILTSTSSSEDVYVFFSSFLATLLVCLGCTFFMGFDARSLVSTMTKSRVWFICEYYEVVPGLFSFVRASHQTCVWSVHAKVHLPHVGTIPFPICFYFARMQTPTFVLNARHDCTLVWNRTKAASQWTVRIGICHPKPIYRRACRMCAWSSNTVWRHGGDYRRK